MQIARLQNLRMGQFSKITHKYILLYLFQEVNNRIFTERVYSEMLCMAKICLL